MEQLDKISYQCSDSGGLHKKKWEKGKSVLNIRPLKRSEILILFSEEDTQEQDFFISLWTGCTGGRSSCRFSALQQTFLFCNATKCEYGENKK